MRTLRKQLPNYDLPTEAMKDLRDLTGRRLTGVSTGVWDRSDTELRRRLGVSDEAPISKLCHGGPLFLEIDSCKTIVIQSDDLTQSLALRLMNCRLTQEILEKLYSEDDYIPQFLQAIRLIELPIEISRGSGLISGVHILKLPDNYRSTPNKGYYPHEIAICLQLATNELIIGYSWSNASTGHSILTSDDLKTCFPHSAIQSIPVAWGTD